jgi:hypothetical protein
MDQVGVRIEFLHYSPLPGCDTAAGKRRAQAPPFEDEHENEDDEGEE